MDDVFDRAGRAVSRLGRPLERARWRAAFEGAPAAEVVDLLAAYQNADGGFGHGVEPDFWNPESSPIQTWAAVEVLRELGWDDRDHPVFRGLLGWLEAELGDRNSGLPTVIASNDAHPHAPWWSFAGAGTSANHSVWNPLAALAGFAWARSAPGDRLSGLCGPILFRAAADFAVRGPGFDPHVTACFVTLAQEVRRAGRAAPFDLPALEAALGEAVGRQIEPDPSKWFTTYCCRPSQLVRAPSEPWPARVLDLARHEARLLAAEQEPEGTWPVAWSWGAYPEAWPVARTWWRGIVAVQNARFLRAFS